MCADVHRKTDEIPRNGLKEHTQKKKGLKKPEQQRRKKKRLKDQIGKRKILIHFDWLSFNLSQFFNKNN